VAEALSGRALLFGTPDTVPPRGNWEGSLAAAATDVLSPLAGSPVLVTLLAWAALAAVLPLLIRGRWLLLDVAGAAIWAVGLMAVLAAVGDLLADQAVLEQARGAVAGALVGALVAVTASQIAPPTAGWRAQPVTTS
jgi:hypothetical protein